MARLSGIALLVATCLVLGTTVHAFYLPGVAPKGYVTNEKVAMRVNKIESTVTQLSYRYYDLPFCMPEEVEDENENLGEILAGDRIENSLYKLFAKYNEYCKTLCIKNYSEEEGALFAERIKQEYTVDWVLDNLPAAVRMYDENNPTEIFYEREFRLGRNDESTDQQYLYNHIRFIIKVNGEEEEGDAVRIVGFEVEPYSVKHTYEGDFNEETQLQTCNDAVHVDRNMEPQRIDQGGEVIFTYDVKWEKSTTAWANRWDLYNKSLNPDDEIHWLSIINSVLIVMFLTGMIAMIVMRALYRDIAKYNEELSLEEQAEETGWKLVHGDVFRPPSGTFGPMALSVIVGSGIQLLMMAFVLIIFAALGFLSPANRGGMVTALLLLYVFMGSFAGYYSSRLYKLWGGKAWKRNTLITAFFFPGVIGGTAFILNFFVWSTGSSQAIPFGTMFALLVLLVCVSVPLVFLGSFFGFKKATIEVPVNTNRFPRVIPPQPWYLTLLPSTLVGGVLPFGAVFIEVFFIMSSIWLHQTYVLFGFLLLVFVILVITCAEIAIVMCYFQLCSEDYKWYWRAFLTPGMSALYLFLYSVVYFATKLEIKLFVSTLIYFGYMFMISVAFFVLTGSIGFISCLFFVRRIYGAIKVD